MAFDVKRIIPGGFRVLPDAPSRAFPGWGAQDIHRALTEDPLSDAGWGALECVALAMGAREGNGTEDDPLVRTVSRTALARGHAQGRAQGHARGHADGRVRGRLEAVAAALRARGIEVAGDFPRGDGLLAGHPIESLMAAALACTGEADFRRRIGGGRAPEPGSGE